MMSTKSMYRCCRSVSSINSDPLNLKLLFRRIQDRQTAPGLELVIIRKLPLIGLVGTTLPLLLSLLARVLPSSDGSATVFKQVTTVDIFVVAMIVTFWTALLTVAIACFIVFVMKGPAYVADAYPLDESDRPTKLAGH